VKIRFLELIEINEIYLLKHEKYSNTKDKGFLINKIKNILIIYDKSKENDI
jgi:hypothetical protein